jgi:hypothetical protein
MKTLQDVMDQTIRDYLEPPAWEQDAMAALHALNHLIASDVIGDRAKLALKEARRELYSLFPVVEDDDIPF